MSTRERDRGRDHHERDHRERDHRERPRHKERERPREREPDRNSDRPDERDRGDRDRDRDRDRGRERERGHDKGSAREITGEVREVRQLRELRELRREVLEVRQERGSDDFQRWNPARGDEDSKRADKRRRDEVAPPAARHREVREVEVRDTRRGGSPERKRVRNESDHSTRTEDGTRRAAPAHQREGVPRIEEGKMHIRLMVDAPLVGGLIGKGGEVVKKLRAESGTWVDIQDAPPGVLKRVVTVKGEFKLVPKGLLMVAKRIAAVEDKKSTSDRGRDQDLDKRLGLTMLIPEKQVGCILGRGGEIINNIRKQSGAYIKIAQAALPDTDEKAVDLGGPERDLRTCLELLCDQLQAPRSLEKCIPSKPFVPVQLLRGTARDYRPPLAVDRTDRDRDRRTPRPPSPPRSHHSSSSSSSSSSPSFTNRTSSSSTSSFPPPPPGPPPGPPGPPHGLPPAFPAAQPPHIWPGFAAMYKNMMPAGVHAAAGEEPPHFSSDGHRSTIAAKAETHDGVDAPKSKQPGAVASHFKPVHGNDVQVIVPVPESFLEIVCGLDNSKLTEYSEKANCKVTLGDPRPNRDRHIIVSGSGVSCNAGVILLYAVLNDQASK